MNRTSANDVWATIADDELIKERNA